jgi:hypothetical protein
MHKLPIPVRGSTLPVLVPILELTSVHFLIRIFPSTIEFISIGSQYLPLLVMDHANTGMGTWHVSILEKNAIAEMPILVQALGTYPYWKRTPSQKCQYWYGHLASAHTGKERHRGNANTGTGTWHVPILEKNAIAEMPILVWALGKCPYWK